MAITPFNVIQDHRDRYQSKARMLLTFHLVPFQSYRSLLFKFCSFFGHFAFLSHSLAGLRTTYDVHLGLIGKRVVDFLLVITELSSLGVTAEVLRAKIDRKSAISLQRGQFDAEFHVEGDVPTNDFLHI